MRDACHVKSTMPKKYICETFFNARFHVRRSASCMMRRKTKFLRID